jgi:uncharacterized protein (TIGR02145 family)
MRKLLFFLVMFSTLKANAQPYSINFSGTGLSTVKVQNLTTGLTVDVPSGYYLRLSTPTGIPEAINKKYSGLKVFPNPMTEKSTLEILPPVAGDAIITIYDLTGKVLTQYRGYLENNSSEFSLSGIKNGFHVINVQGNGYQFSEKLLSNGKSNGKAIITRISNNANLIAEKKSIMDSKGSQPSVDMAYNSGERLKFTAISGNNSTVMTDIPSADKIVTFTFTECKDGDNIYYPVVQIGAQLWMAENLKTTKYRNSEIIGTTTPATFDISGETTPKYQWAYDGSESNVATYGRLYTWYVVTDSRNVCPTGWHVPTSSEWSALFNYLKVNGYNYDGTTTDDYKAAKSLAASSGWNSSSTSGAVGNIDYPTKRNATGFSALPGGKRYDYFAAIGYYSWWWSSSQWDVGTGTYFVIIYENTGIYSGGDYMRFGHSVRCLKD